MTTFGERLAEIKSELQPSLQSRMIFLLNPKDTKILEAIVAWTVSRTKVRTDMPVDDNATLEELWGMTEPDIFAFSTALGCKIAEALPRLDQLKQLAIIYPDGSIAELAMSIVNVYIKNRVNDIRKEED